MDWTIALLEFTVSIKQVPTPTIVSTEIVTQGEKVNRKKVRGKLEMPINHSFPLMLYWDKAAIVNAPITAPKPRADKSKPFNSASSA